MSSTHHAKRLYVGTSAERTALSLTSDGRGIVWYDTDEDRAYIWSGSAWIEATKVSEIWETDGGAVAWQTNAAGDLSNVDGESLSIKDDSPVDRITLSPGASATAAQLSIKDTVRNRFIMSSGTSGGQTAELNVIDELGTIGVTLRDDGTIQLLGSFVRIGDTDTRVDLSDDQIDFQAGGAVLLSLTEDVQDLVEIGDVAGTGDVDVNINAGQVFVEGSSGKVGIGTNTIPHGGIGAAILALDGADSSTGGPHIQVTTATDDYPLSQFLFFSHDNIQWLIDTYYDGAVKSGDAGSNFRIAKLGDKLHIQSDVGIAQGSAVTFEDLMTFDPTNLRVGIRTQSPAAGLDIALSGSTPAAIFGDGLSNAFIHFNGAAATVRDMRFQSAGVNRWVLRVNSVAEGGSDSGSDFEIISLTDAGGTNDRIFYITRDTARVGINSTSPSGKLHVDQTSTTAAIPVLFLDQADVSEPFIRFDGTAAASTLTQSIVAEADVSTATRQGFIKIFVNDAGNQITDQAYFVPIFTLA